MSRLLVAVIRACPRRCILARDYSIDVRVLEAGAIGWGASGRNGGFCTIGGSKLEAAEMIRRYGFQRGSSLLPEPG